MEKLKKNFCTFEAYSIGSESMQVSFASIVAAASKSGAKKSVSSDIIENSNI